MMRYRGRGGFTLIELIVVVVIVGLAMGVAAGRIDFLLPKYRLRAAAREVGATVKQARSRAASTGKEVYVEFDLAQSTYWLLVAFPKDPGEGAFPTATKEFEYLRVYQRTLPEDISFVDVIMGKDNAVNTGRARVRVSPFGSAGHVVVNIKSKEGREMALRVNGFTGALTFYEERKEADELLEDESY